MVDGKDWGRLTKVMLARSQAGNGAEAPVDDVESPDRVMVSIRIPAEQLAEIDRRAKSAGLTSSEFMLRAALGSDPLAERLASIEERLGQLESAQAFSSKPVVAPGSRSARSPSARA